MSDPAIRARDVNRHSLAMSLQAQYRALIGALSRQRAIVSLCLVYRVRMTVSAAICRAIVGAKRRFFIFAGIFVLMAMPVPAVALNWAFSRVTTTSTWTFWMPVKLVKHLLESHFARIPSLRRHRAKLGREDGQKFSRIFSRNDRIMGLMPSGLVHYHENAFPRKW